MSPWVLGEADEALRVRVREDCNAETTASCRALISFLLCACVRERDVMWAVHVENHGKYNRKKL